MFLEEDHLVFHFDKEASSTYSMNPPIGFQFIDSSSI